MDWTSCWLHNKILISVNSVHVLHHSPENPLTDLWRAAPGVPLKFHKYVRDLNHKFLEIIKAVSLLFTVSTIHQSVNNKEAFNTTHQ